MENYQVIDLIIKAVGVYALSRLSIYNGCKCDHGHEDSGDLLSELDVDYGSINVSLDTTEINQVFCDIILKKTEAGVVFHSYCSTLTECPHKVSILVNAMSRAETEKENFEFVHSAEHTDYHVRCTFIEEPKKIEPDTESIKSRRSFRHLFNRN